MASDFKAYHHSQVKDEFGLDLVIETTSLAQLVFCSRKDQVYSVGVCGLGLMCIDIPRLLADTCAVPIQTGPSH